MVTRKYKGEVQSAKNDSTTVALPALTRVNNMNLERQFPAMIGNQVTVRIPDGLPTLMMKVAKHVIRNPAAGELETYSIIADYLECLLEERSGKEDNLNDMVTRLIKADAEKYLDRFIQLGYTVEDLDKLARNIQRGWKRYKIRTTTSNDFAKLRKLAQTYGQSLKTTNEAAAKIQGAWKKFCKSNPHVKRSISNTVFSSKQFKTEFLDEIDYEDDSDDMERVNVVKKGQRDYVPPIPDFIDNLHSINSRSMTNVIDEFGISSFDGE